MKIINKINKFIGFITIVSLIKLLLDKLGLIKNQYKISLNNKLKIWVRPTKELSVSDIEIFKEIYIEDVYGVCKFKSKDIFIIDIGAHVGIFSLLIAKNSGAIVLAYEPDIENFKILEKNINENKKFVDVRPFNLSISNRKGNVKVFKSSNNTGGHSIYQTYVDQKYFVSKSITLNQIIKENKIESIDLLKIDCEGAEYEILTKTSKTTLKKIKKIILETHEFIENRKNFYNYKNIITSLEEAGFKIKIKREIFYSDEGLFKIIIAENENRN